MSDVIAAMSDVSSWDDVHEHVTLLQKILACPAQYKDFITGEVISQDRILHICKTLDNQQKLFEEGRAIYSQVKHRTQGSEEAKKMAARNASNGQLLLIVQCLANVQDPVLRDDLTCDKVLVLGRASQDLLQKGHMLMNIIPA
jgi:hypothetical protein